MRRREFDCKTLIVLDKLEQRYKKSLGLLCERIGVRYQMIDAEKKAYPAALLSDVMQVSRRV